MIVLVPWLALVVPVVLALCAGTTLVCTGSIIYDQRRADRVIATGWRLPVVALCTSAAICSVVYAPRASIIVWLLSGLVAWSVLRFPPGRPARTSLGAHGTPPADAWQARRTGLLYLAFAFQSLAWFLSI